MNPFSVRSPIGAPSGWLPAGFAAALLGAACGFAALGVGGAFGANGLPDPPKRVRPAPTADHPTNPAVRARLKLAGPPEKVVELDLSNADLSDADLRQAQLWLLHEGLKRTDEMHGLELAAEPGEAVPQVNELSPRFWAAFELSGDWR
ncbi:MAG TPA: hypothetical protein VHX65_07470 [Pirellulales bacterium]|jgi:hypothetical protein|nr:hypothetical protein [Pirellulales bacterium]